MMDFGNGVYRRGNNMVFEVPKIIAAAKQPVTTVNIESVAECIRGIAPIEYPKFNITILKGKADEQG